MKTNNLTEIICIIDKSGSMASIRDDAVGGFNSFLKDQKNKEEDALITLNLFDHEFYEMYQGKNIKYADELTYRSYVPGGMTALNDAIGISIDRADLRHANLEKAETPDNVIVAILTDGMENSSKEYSTLNIKRKIKIHEDKYNWKFIFLAANQDAVLTGRGYGIKDDYSMDFDTDKEGMKMSFDVINEAYSRARNNKDLKTLKEEMMKKHKKQ
jgi:Mg-chelatase subunit ChlD